MKMLNLRQAIIQRVQDKNDEELHEIIKGSIGHDEKALPGLGVLFEIIWDNIDEEQQNALTAALHNSLLHKSGDQI